MRILDHTIAGTPLREVPRVLAEVVAPQTMWRIHTGYTMTEHLPVALEQGADAGPYAWTLLSELMDCRPSVEQLHTAVVDTGVTMIDIRRGLEPGLAESDELEPCRARRIRRLLDLTEARLRAES